MYPFFTINNKNNAGQPCIQTFTILLLIKSLLRNVSNNIFIRRENGFLYITYFYLPVYFYYQIYFCFHCIYIGKLNNVENGSNPIY